MLMLAIMERKKYLGKNTYLVYADAEKCFDNLWLDDGIVELWRCGMNIRDAMMVRKMNKRAEITIRTPSGNTDKLVVEDTVRQGTVYAMDICGVSMDRVNKEGKEVITMYGPELTIQATIFVDDVSCAGSCVAANNTINNLSILESRKKMTFNNKNGKTEYTIIPSYKDNKKGSITAEVKRGEIPKAVEHKALGLWLDESGRYDINITKNRKKLPHMIAVIKAWACQENIGNYAATGRLKLAEQ